MALFDAKAAVDLVIATPEDIERYGDSPPLVYRRALREGRVVYEKPLSDSRPRRAIRRASAGTRESR